MIKLIATIVLFVSTLPTLASTTEKFTYFRVNKGVHSEIYHNNRTEFKIKITKHEIILMEKDGFSQSYPIITGVKPKSEINETTPKLIDKVKRTSNKVVYKIKEGSVIVSDSTVTFEFNN